MAGGLALAGVAAVLGHRGSPAAEIAAAAGAVAPGAIAPGGSLDAAPAALADLVDLDRVALADAGDHYEAPMKDGRHAILTIDPRLQAYAEKLLTESRAPRGAIVAMAPDGRILALAGRRSRPAPAKPRGKAAPHPAPGAGKPAASDGGAAKPAAGDDLAPGGAFDWRLATEVWAPAASVFKLVTASALIAAGVRPDDKVCFHGGLRSVRLSNLRDDKRDSRCESLSYGVAHSNNAILGKLAFQKLEPTALAKCAHDLGVADPLPGEDLRGATGAIDIPTARDLRFAQIAAGFSGSQLSALGGALLAATFAAAGEQPVPRLIASINGVAQPVLAPRRALPAEVARAVGQMMVATCELGSAVKSFGRRHGLRVAGKTGTLTWTEPFYMEHSWFVGYAPAETPEIIVSVVLGNPENWHLRGHEAARRMFDLAIGREKHRAVKINSTRRVGW
jgi:penicillin-binding protein A